MTQKIMTKKEVLEYLTKKGIEYRIIKGESNALEIKHCLFCEHKEKWCATIFKESVLDSKVRDWYYMCYYSPPGMNTLYDGIPLESIMDACDHQIDAIRNKSKFEK